MEAAELRSTFLRFFADRDHVIVPSASLIANDPTLLFTIAGMVPFKAYFTGEEVAPWPRAATVQKCFRIPDIDVIGTTTRHLTFFEMLGNFSFGDYFKEDAIRFAWDLMTGGFGLDSDRLWVTVHEDDDEAAELWPSVTGLVPERVQRLGADNFWEMGPVGPCGPSSEIFVDKGDAHGDPGGPAFGGAERYVEIWNLVFMQFERAADGTLTDLPRKNIDTGSGFERTLSVINHVDSVFATDLFAPLLDAAQRLTDMRLGTSEASDVALRRIAEHGRAMTMLVADGVLPSNEGRGYVLRRVVRRAVLAARRLGSERAVTGDLVAATIEKMGAAHPELLGDRELIEEILAREEAAFSRALKNGLSLLEEEAAAVRSRQGTVFGGDAAFRLHDTHGFPIELTEEVLAEHGLTVDMPAYDTAMAEQRARARAAIKRVSADEPAYRELLDRVGSSEFVGREPLRYEIEATVAGVLAAPDGLTEVFLDSTPFYAEAGGQVGDTGQIVTETGTLVVADTQNVIGGLFAHRGRLVGEMHVGQSAVARIDAARRESIRRNHTATHLLHAALRSVLGTHVRQQSSFVAPDRLRFDFSHDGGLAPEEWDAVTGLVNEDVLDNAVVTTANVSKREAEQMGALAFFGDKYGERVRVVRAGEHSLEFCGGTHVHQLGDIGQVQIVTESSIGANTRRLEAVSGLGALSRSRELERHAASAASLLKTSPEDLAHSVERLLERQRELERSLGAMKQAKLAELINAVDAESSGASVVARIDGVGADQLRQAALEIQRRGRRSVVLAGVGEDGKVAVVAATDGSTDAKSLVNELAARVGGGGGGSSTLALAGGKLAGGVDAALAAARALLFDSP